MKKLKQRRALFFRQGPGVFLHAHAVQRPDDHGLFHSQLTNQLLNGKFLRYHAVRVSRQQDMIFLFQKIAQQRERLILAGQTIFNSLVHNASLGLECQAAARERRAAFQAETAACPESSKIHAV